MRLTSSMFTVVRLTLALSLPAFASQAISSPISFTENFSGGGPGPNLTLGTPGGSATVSYASDAFTVTSGSGPRIYLGTNSADYSTVSFTFAATAIFPATTDPGAIAFFGMGSSNATGSYYEPASPPNALAVIVDGWTGYSGTGYTLGTRDNGSVGPNTTISSDSDVLGDTERIQMSWNAATQQALFQLETKYTGGPFIPNYSETINAATYGFNATNSQLILGGGDGLQFTDVVVIATPEPASLVLIGIGAALLLWKARRRRA